MSETIITMINAQSVGYAKVMLKRVERAFFFVRTHGESMKAIEEEVVKNIYSKYAEEIDDSFVGGYEWEVAPSSKNEAERWLCYDSESLMPVPKDEDVLMRIFTEYTNDDVFREKLKAFYLREKGCAETCS